MYNTSKGYKEKILEDSTQHELNIYIDGNKIEPNHIIDFSSTSELFNNNELCLGCTPEKDIEFEIDKRDLPENYNEVYVETGIKYHNDIVTEGEEITLKEEKEIPLNLEISGNHKQKTYSGKNILNFGASKSGTINGITYSYDENTQIWTVNGTATAKTDVHFGSIIKSKANKVYQLETFHLGGSISSESCKIYMQDENQNWAGWSCQLLNVDARQPATKDKNLSMGLLIFRIESGITLNNYKFKAQFEQTDNPTVVEWEPYVGGILSPNPNYPSEIKTVGSNVNLAKETQIGYWNNNGVFDYDSNFASSKQIEVDEGKIYIASLFDKNKKYVGKMVYVLFDKDKNFTRYSGEETITIANNEKYVSIRTYANQKKYINDNDYLIKLEEGSTPTSYSPYGQGSVKVRKCNKNLFNAYSSDLLYYLRNTDKEKYTINNSNSIKVEGTGVSWNRLEITISNLKPNTKYTITSQITNITQGWAGLLCDYDNNNIFKVSNKEQSNPQITIITDENGKVKIQFYTNYTSTVQNSSAIFNDIELEEGSTATTYETHQEQSYIMPVQQEMLKEDYFDFDNEEEVHNWNKLVLNGTEEWIKANNKETDTVFAIFVTNGVNDSEMSNSFLKAHLASSIAEKARVFNGSLYIEINTNRLSEDTVDGFKSWLKSLYDEGTPVIVYYKLSTPTRLPFTEEQKEIAKELSHATTYEGTTHIYSTDSISPVLKTTCGSEIVPIGKFTIQKPIEDDEFKVKIKATDYMKKFEDNKYDGSNLTYPKTMLEVLEDICQKAGVELGSTSFLNSEKQIAVYDNTVTARTYLGYIAEQAGGFAVIGRDGKLYIKTFGEDTINFNVDLFGDFTWGDKLKVSRVSYEDGIQNYKFGDETQATVFIDQNNMYIVDSEQVENIYNQIKDFEVYTFEGETIIDPAYDIGDILVIDGKKVLYQGEIKYAGKFKASINNKVQAKTEQESMQTKQTNSNKIKRVQSEINQIDGKITQLVQETTENEEKITQAQQDIDGFTQKVATKDELTEKVNELKHTIEGITLQAKETGGGNIFFYAKEYWRGQEQDSEATLEEYTNTLIQQNNVSDEGYLINNGVSIQSQVVKNGQYVISFNYYKLKEDATGYVKVNEVEYKLDGNINTWIEKIIPVEITSNNIKIEIGSDTVASYYISDLMVSMGIEKAIWQQNANETRTDTVEIGKGIQVNSSTKNTYTRIDADGNRTFNSSTNERVAEMTDKGVYTKQLEVKEQAKINVLLIQQIGSQVWLTGLGG